MQEDVIGTEYGHLKVVEKLPSDEWRRQRYRCECDCGGEIIINSAQLRRRIPDHCGCQKQIMRSDLKGKTFGKLEVLGPSDKRGSRGKRSASISVKKYRYKLGVYAELSDAIAARKRAEELVKAGDFDSLCAICTNWLVPTKEAGNG